jgi:4-hydroxythreonine-4-phosphate dehydrogenase
MTDLALAGKLDAVCFAPLNKAALHRGGWNYHDEHQMFADWTRHSGYYSEMNVIPEFSTFRVTSHVSLRKALDRHARARRGGDPPADRTMRSTGSRRRARRRGAESARRRERSLWRRGDPHHPPDCGRVRASGIDCTGPLPSDTIFPRARAGISTRW